MDSHKLTRRSGFTLIELLAVISVITLMMTLLVRASYRFVVEAREAATAATITKASGLIQDRARAFQEFDLTDAAIEAQNAWNAANSASWYNCYSWVTVNSTTKFTLFDVDDGIKSTALAQVLVRKTRFKKAFPQAFVEMDSAQLARLFPTAAGALPTSLPSTYNARFESGIMLYAILMKGETFGAPTPGDDTFTGAEIKISAETGNLPCLVDAWGEPLRFYRWPTRLIRCGEQDFDGDGANDDINQNLVQDLPGWVDVAPPSPPGYPVPTFSPAIRPNATYKASTPASILISNLPPYNNTGAPTTYVFGPDGASGTSGATAPMNYLGFPDTDDPEPLNTDPDDPSLRLSSWLFDNNLNSSQQGRRRGYFVSDFHDFYTYHTPLIVSAGPDRQLGLYEPSDFTSTAGYLAAPKFGPGTSGPALLQFLFDNITNLNQRAGGR